MARSALVQTGLHDVTLFSKTSGVVDSLDPVRVAEEGLVKAENVVIDLSGAAKRREGSTLLTSGECHSLFSCGSYGLGVFAGVMKVIESDYSIASLAVTVGNSKVSYAKVFDGMNDLVYFSNGVVNGKIVNKVYAAWTTGAYVGVDSTTSGVVEYLTAPPVGQLLEIFAGRMYVAVKNLVYVSEYQDFSRFRVIPFIYDSNVTMMKGLNAGMFVGTLEEVFFHGGTDPWAFSTSKVYGKGAIDGTDVKVTSSEIALQAAGEVVVFSVFGEGICIGDNSGNVANLTSIPITFPESRQGACCITKEKQYIVSL